MNKFFVFIGFLTVALLSIILAWGAWGVSENQVFLIVAEVTNWLMILMYFFAIFYSVSHRKQAGLIFSGIGLVFLGLMMLSTVTRLSLPVKLFFAADVYTLDFLLIFLLKNGSHNSSF